MNRYLLIESRDPYTSAEVANHMALAVGLRRAGAEVALYLVQDGVLPCRAGADGDALHEALGAGIEVLADDHSLAERGIGHAQVARGVRPSSIGQVVDRLADAWKVVFF